MTRIKVWIDIKTTGLDELTDEIHQIAAKCGKDEVNFYTRFKVVPKNSLHIPAYVRRVTLEDALIELHIFVEKMSEKYDPPKIITNKYGEIEEQRQGLTFAGKNPLLVHKFLMKQILFLDTWKKYFHYNLFDLTPIIYFLKDLGIIPPDQSSKLEDLVKYFKVKIDGKPHDALFDVKATDQIYELTKEMIKGKAIIPKKIESNKLDKIKIVVDERLEPGTVILYNAEKQKVESIIKNLGTEKEPVVIPDKPKPFTKKKPIKRKPFTKKS